MNNGLYKLVYVCKYCGGKVAAFQSIRSTEPVTWSVCEKRACLDKASDAYKATA